MGTQARMRGERSISESEPKQTCKTFPLNGRNIIMLPSAQCRDCKQVCKVYPKAFLRSSPPRCSVCGGMLDCLGYGAQRRVTERQIRAQRSDQLALLIDLGYSVTDAV